MVEAELGGKNIKARSSFVLYFFFKKSEIIGTIYLNFSYRFTLTTYYLGPFLLIPNYFFSSSTL